jgi:hypothetical protein
MPFFKGHKYNLGKKYSKEHIEKVRSAHLARGKSKIVACGICKKKRRYCLAVIKKGKGKYCSRACASKAQEGKSTWNKGLKGFRTGKRPDVQMPKGENNFMWKGDKVGYFALHSWISRVLGKPSFCENCKITEPPKLGKNGTILKNSRSYFHWANISGLYKRSLEDWKRLCYACHADFDHNLRKIS